MASSGFSRPVARGRGRGTRSTNMSDLKIITQEHRTINNNEVGRSETTTLTFPKSMKGALIGKQGAKIKEMRDSSGATIDIEDGTEAGQCMVKIRGLQSERDKAKKLVEEVVSMSDAASKGQFDDVDEDLKIPRWGNVDYGKPVVEEEPTTEAFTPIDWEALNANREENERLMWAHLPDISKEFYTQHPDVTARSEEECEAYRRKMNNIEVKNFSEDDNSPIMKPITTFVEAFHEFPDVLATINKQGFKFPSPIQSQAWPYLLSGKDMIGIAQTGTGKTLAFLLPAMIHIDNQKLARGKRGGPNVLVLAPTRELAQQISMEVAKYEYKKIKSVCVYGGGSIQVNMYSLLIGCSIQYCHLIGSNILFSCISQSSVQYCLRIG